MALVSFFAPVFLVAATLARAAAPVPAPWGQQAQATPVPAKEGPSGGDGRPLPDPKLLLQEVEANEERMDRLREDYTYHVHLEQRRLRKDGSTKEQEITDAESLTLEGVRVDRTVARNGRSLDAKEQEKENDRIEKVVERAKKHRDKANAEGQKTNAQGDTIITVARLLQLGNFTGERRVEWKGRPTILLDFAGDPAAKTQSPAEAVVRDLVGTVWIDEADRVVVRGQGHFLKDFKVGGGLIADVRKDSHFDFEATHVNDAVWLPSTVNGQGEVRLFLVAGFDGELQLTTSDYRRFRTSAHIVEGPREGAPSAPVLPQGSPAKPDEPARPLRDTHTAAPH